MLCMYDIFSSGIRIHACPYAHGHANASQKYRHINMRNVNSFFIFFNYDIVFKITNKLCL